ncbi:MAG: diaminopimelate epimerase [Oligoflexia bacterium]|nr:diaminopimelate epimerase [Oligoflexia bacterium]
MRLRKYHGIGNDYLVLETADPLSPDLVRRLCDRHRGVGSDGLLQPLPLRRDPQDGRPVSPYAVRIWNPDGSRAEKSGNGLRIFARWLVDHRAAASDFGVEVRTFDQPGTCVRCTVEPPAGTGSVTVLMGPAQFEAAQVPCTRPLLDAPVQVGERVLRVTAVGTGNPHCVVFLDDVRLLDQVPWRDWGATLETHPLFPNRTNVQFAVVVHGAPADPPGSTRIVARIWERGAGETQASGSSSCAIAAAARRLGKAGDQVVVEMPGGELWVTLGPDDALVLRGPVQEIGAVELSTGWLSAGRGTGDA